MLSCLTTSQFTYSPSLVWLDSELRDSIFGMTASFLYPSPCLGRLFPYTTAHPGFALRWPRLAHNPLFDFCLNGWFAQTIGQTFFTTTNGLLLESILASARWPSTGPAVCRNWVDSSINYCLYASGPNRTPHDASGVAKVGRASPTWSARKVDVGIKPRDALMSNPSRVDSDDVVVSLISRIQTLCCLKALLLIAWRTARGGR